jgi:thioredoxin-related protein
MMRRTLIAFLILACAMCAAAARTVRADPLPLAGDLAAAAAQARARRIPVLIAFTTSVCPYCRIARRDHLEPLHISPEWRNRAVMLDLQLDAEQKLTDFQGRVTTPGEFAKRMGVRAVPTIMVFDADGIATTTPLVGLLTADYYSAYIEQALETGLIKMRYPQKKQ